MSRLEEMAELMDSIDASVFSGDIFHSKAGVELLELYVGRWSRALEDIKDVVIEFGDVEE